jgi:amidase
MSEVTFGSATAAAEMVSRKEISSRELTQFMLERIDTVNPALNAVVEIRREEALVDASAADDAVARGDELGPLHGLPMTVKESFNVSGMHTTWGNPTFKDYVADWDATVVSRLRRAGAIIVGKTNPAFMLADFGQTSNELYGVTNNPWDTARTPGGSSGGAAAAVAAGLSFLEYGTDLVGSIRIPAAFCGVYGLKPSVGIVPSTGMQPPGPPPPPSDMLYMSAVGPLGRSAADLRTALKVTAGREEPAAMAYSWALPPPRRTRLGDHRVGVVFDHAGAPISSEIAGVLSNAADAVAQSGATVVEGWPEGVDPTRDYGTFGYHVQLFFAFQQPDEGFERLGDFVEQENRRMAVRAAWNRYFKDFDVLLCPVNFTAAFPHDPRPFAERTIPTPEGERPYDEQAFWVSHASLPGLPAVAAPLGHTASGLPVGAQVIGPLYEDDAALSFAELLGEVVGGYERPATA